MSRLKRVIENNKGITLIEILISITILGVVLAIATSMIIQTFNIAPSGTRRMSAKQMAEMHVTEIARYVRNANPDDIGEDEIDGILEYDGDVIEIIESDRIFNNIMEFEINDEGNNDYRITLKKEYEGDEGEVTTVVSPRNQ